MRLDGMAEQKPRTEFGAEPALIAGRAPDSLHVEPRSLVPQDEFVRGGQNNDSSRGLCYRVLKAGSRTRHHDAAEQHSEVIHSGPARGFDHLADGDSDGYPKRDGRSNCPGHGEVFVSYRQVETYVDECFHV